MASPTKNDLKEKIEELKKYLRYDIRHTLPRPFLIEFAGPPSVGKTSVISELDDFMRPLGLEKVWPPQEGPRQIRFISRKTPDYNLRTAFYSLSMLLDESHASRHDLILFDRCAFDAYCWAEYWYQKGQINVQEKYIFQSFYMNPRFTKKIDICYFLVCDPEISMKREFKNAISDELRETTNLESIKKLDKIWREAFDNLKTLHSNIRLVDTSKLTVSEMTQNIAQDMINTLELKTKSSK